MSTPMTSQQVHACLRGLAEQDRRRAIHRHRLFNGVRTLVRQAWTLIFPALIVTLAVTAYLNRSRAATLLAGNNTIPEMIQVWEVLLAAIIVVFAILALLGMVALLGRPRKAHKIDTALVHAGIVDRYGVGPALVRSEPMKGTNICTMTFYSAGISLETWAEKQRAIEDVLDLSYIEPPNYGKYHGKYHRNYIVLTVIPGTATKRTTPLYDDTF